MEGFCWDHKFETGLKDVDKQHKHLVTLANNFGSKIIAGDVDQDTFNTLFTELANYTVYHFNEEEKIMAELSLDPRHVKEHIKSHQNFLSEVTVMQSCMKEGDNSAAQNLLKFLAHWLVYHILGADKKMGHQVLAIKDGKTPKEAYEREKQTGDETTDALFIALTGLFDELSLQHKNILLLNQSLEEKVSERTQKLVEANARLQAISRTDTLTDLPNRRAAMQFLADYWREHKTITKPMSCMMLDADYFKDVNDKYGHDAGDIVLKFLANKLRDSVRNDDIVCRLGGDEFLIICPQTDTKSATLVADTICNKIAHSSINTPQVAWQGSVSIGVATMTESMTGFEQLIKAADNGVYVAKEAGRGCVRIGYLNTPKTV